MQARAGAIDELVASGALTDVSSMGKDNITVELERMASENDVNAQLEAMKRELSPGAPKPEIEG
jgi:phage shock protein A